MFGVDDGIVNGNLDFADVMFFVAVVLGVIAGVLTVATTQHSRFASLFGWLAVAALALGWFVL